MQGPLYQNDYKPQFSGHETFPLRYGWLKKAYDRVEETTHLDDNKTACWGEDAIAHFGVGKNMVASMRHWAKATGIINEPDTHAVHTTTLGDMLFSEDGLDPYMEHPTTLWLLHWKLASHPKITTWFWAFSHHPAITFTREELTKQLDRLAKNQNWSRAAIKTIQNDVACFTRTYVAKQSSDKAEHDDTLESPLTELGLIKATGKTDGFRFVRSPKATLSNGMFAYALYDFWQHHARNSSTLSFDAIAHGPGGLGRVFQFDENDVVDRLVVLDHATNGVFRWSEATGLKQVTRAVEVDEDTARSWISSDYKEQLNKEVA